MTTSLEPSTAAYEPHPNPSLLTSEIVYERVRSEAGQYAANVALQAKLGIVETELTNQPLNGPHTWLCLDESVQPGNNFKYDGAGNAVDHAAAAYPEGTSLLVPSAGNWALAAVIAASNYGLPVEVYCPQTVSEAKRDLIVHHSQELGVEVQIVDHFTDVAKARQAAHKDAKRCTDAVVLDPFDSLYGLSGQALVAERAVKGVVAQVEAGTLDPAANVVFTPPVGGGSLATAVGVKVREAKDSGRLGELAVTVLGVRPETNTPQLALYDGLNVPHVGHLARHILNNRHFVQGKVSISEAQTGRAADLVYRALGKKAEPAGLASVAGMLADIERRSQPTTYVTFVTGTNVTDERYAYFQQAPARAQRALLGVDGPLDQLRRKGAQPNDKVPGLLSGPTAWKRDQGLASAKTSE